MTTYLIYLGVAVWVFMLAGYEDPKKMSSDKDDKLELPTNAKALNALLSGLSES